MAATAMTLSHLDGHFCCLKPFSHSRTSGNVTRINYDVSTRESNSERGL